MGNIMIKKDDIDRIVKKHGCRGRAENEKGSPGHQPGRLNTGKQKPMNNITDNPDKANYQDEQNRLRTLLLGNGKGSSTKPTTLPTGSKQSKAKGGHGTRQQHTAIIRVDVQDIARIKAEAGTSSPLLGYWIALNRIASIYGNPFTAAYSILRVESYLADRQISACNKKLEALKMLLVVRDKGTKNPNTYKLLTGAYSEQ